MGNLIKSCEDRRDSIQRKYAKTLSANSALGKISTRHMSEKIVYNKSKKNNMNWTKNKTDVRNELEFIFQEIFTPPARDIDQTFFYKNFPTEESKNSTIDTSSKIILTRASKLYNSQNETALSFVSLQTSIKKSCNFNVMNTEDCEVKLNSKTGEILRRSYLAKLISKNVWEPTVKEKDHNNILIFDWDDTLLCTSFLTPGGILDDQNPMSDREIENLQKLEHSVVKLLKLAILRGQTYIITNAASGWVEYTTRRYFPSLIKILPQVNIVSARNEFEKLYPGNCRQWKILTFLKTLNNFNVNLITNIICVGDSMLEMEAAHVLASNFKKAYIKTIKFKQFPQLNELYKQINLLIDNFQRIFSSVKNMNIKVSKKQMECEN